MIRLALAALTALNFTHLDWLKRPAGKQVTWQIYASAVKKDDRAGPYRYVGDEDEGIGCVDDVARAAILYARHGARTHDPRALAQARAALEAVLAQDRGDGAYFNFLWGDGSPNKTGPTSRPGLNWWTARALWALGEGALAFRASDPAYADRLRARAMRTVALLETDLARRDNTWKHGGPGWFVGDGADATAVVVLGLAALDKDRTDARVAWLMARYAEAIALWAPGTGPLADAHLPSLVPNMWHSYGAHMLHALAEAGQRLHASRLIDAARREADHFTPRVLLAGGPVASYTPSLHAYPQIAYGVEPTVLGLLALADATGDARYAKLGGLFASWLTGNNSAHRPMYDAATGRAWDGIDPKGASTDSGAESTIEAMLTLEALASHPELEPYLNAKKLTGPHFQTSLGTVTVTIPLAINAKR
ncbi:MAG: hypothetical protein JWM80_5381 [Cyanobacteria bacterium RYN_339]|nr:hypothetical protein [Cyanobacteria bacterium RYN_339]